MRNKFLIREQDFPVRFYREALPYLKERRTGSFFEPEPGIPLWTEHYDTEIRPVKGIVVMLHGYLEPLQKFYETVYYFLQNGYHVRQLQLRGHGKSFRHVSDPYLLHVPDYRLFLRDFDRYLHRLILPDNTEGLPLYLYAHSMGGALSALYLSLRPDVFSKAVLSSPMMEIKRGSLRCAMEYTIVSAACKAGQGEHYALGMEPYDGSWTYEHSHVGTYARWRYVADMVDADLSCQTWGASWQMVKELIDITKAVRAPECGERIVTPVIVFSASDDGLVTRKGQVRFVANTKSARLIDVPGSKHEIYSGTDEVLELYWNRILRHFS